MADAFTAYINALQDHDFLHHCFQKIMEEENRYDEKRLEQLRSGCRDLIKHAVSFLQNRESISSPSQVSSAVSLVDTDIEVLADKWRQSGQRLTKVLTAISILHSEALHLYEEYYPQDESIFLGLHLLDAYFDRVIIICAEYWMQAEVALKQKQLREANHFILQEKRRYRSIFNRMAEPALIVDQEHKIIDTNKALEIFFAIDKKNIIGENCAIILGPETCKEFRIQQAMENESSFSDLETELSVNGQQRNVLVAGTFLGEINGAFSGGIIILQDITEKKRYEWQLQESKEKYRSLVENVPDVTWRTDENGLITFVSPNVKQVIGYDVDEIIKGGRQAWLERIFHDDRDMVVSQYAGIFVHNVSIDICYRLQRADGEWIWLRERTGKVYEQDGIRSVDGVLCDVTNLKQVEYELEQHHLRLAEIVDRRTEELRWANEKLQQEITERQQTEEELRQLTHCLRESNAELEQFAQVASHDMKEPLVLISAFAERLAQRYAHCLDAKGKEFLQRIISSASKLRDLINALLELARVSTNPGIFQCIDLQELLREVVDQMEEQLRESKGEITIHSSHSLEGDRMQVWQLFQNLLGNAIKYRRPGIPLRVVIESRSVEGEFCEISIEDNGIGFSEDDSEKIFIPFARLGQTRHYEGTGIGLATCRKIVARHGGEITARSLLGQGATFIVRMPFRRVEK